MPGSYVEAFTPLYYRINCQPNNPTLESRSRLTFFVPLLWYCAGFTIKVILH